MKRLPYSILVLLLNAVPAVSQQSGTPDTAALPSSDGRRSVSVSAPVVSLRAVGVPAEKLKIVGVSNAGKISTALFRGAQPSAQGLAELKKLGVTTIVDLRGNRGEVDWERRQAESLGMRFVNIPILGWSSPADTQVAQFLRLFDNTNQKIFVHCRFGEDRTGVMVAAYRIALQKWNADQALQEMNSFGFHYHLYRGMRSYVRKFPDNYASEAAFAALRSGPSAVNAAPVAP
jgi:tyrosine-protein phosphatase SIW14